MTTENESPSDIHRMSSKAAEKHVAKLYRRNGIVEKPWDKSKFTIDLEKMFLAGVKWRDKHPKQNKLLISAKRTAEMYQRMKHPPDIFDLKWEKEAKR